MTRSTSIPSYRELVSMAQRGRPMRQYPQHSPAGLRGPNASPPSRATGTAPGPVVPCVASRATGSHRPAAIPSQAAVYRPSAGGHAIVQPGRSGAADPRRADGTFQPVDADAAEDFLRLYYSECPEAGSLDARLRQVKAMIADIGTYRHTSAELEFGARVAWRNSSRCIGRLYWQSLRVHDRRTARTPQAVFDHLVSHLREATNAGRIRPLISIFAPAAPGEPFGRVWNEQLVRYAGYRTNSGQVIGDPRYVEFTAAVEQLGWSGKRSAFDILPVAIDLPGHRPQLFDLPEDAVLEVPLSHPSYPWFVELGLRWHAVPAISNMRLEIGGVHYPFAPFNGWYMGSEIGARNLADADRYDLIPVIAQRLGLDTRTESTLWRDRALVELNVAVLHSFHTAGVKISDHHTESRRFLTHLEREERAGRMVPADWSWIVPPISGGITPVFHRYYDEADLHPNFHLDGDARDLGTQGRCPHSP